MAGGITIKISGGQETIARLRGYPKDVVAKASMAGVYAVGNALIAKAMPLTPKLGGHLRASMKCAIPTVKGDTASTVVGAGGDAVQYAAVQHQGFMERGGKRIVFQEYTEPGTGPLFLDKAAEALRPQATAIFAQAFRAVLKRGGKGGLPGGAPSGGEGGGESSKRGGKHVKVGKARRHK